MIPMDTNEKKEVIELEVDRKQIEQGRVKVEGTVINIRGLKDGDVFDAMNKRWRLVQRKERVLHLKLDDVLKAFNLGYAIGNLHMRAMISGNDLYIPLEDPNLEEELRDFNPDIQEIKFVPNVEIPIRVKMVDFTDH
uniref:Urease accessory protein UreE C-terminal domain-containing protein n=2 Tax=Metallosphaera hakonensis TaxID=79601 RepID=A0A2U9IQZ0_9CREN